MVTGRGRQGDLLALVVSLLAALGFNTSTATAAEAYSKETLYFSVTVGPEDDQDCTIIGDLYLPEGASATDRAPAVLTTNGFGGSKDDQAGVSAALAERGDVALSYSSLGFGGSSCKITPR